MKVLFLVLSGLLCVGSFATYVIHKTAQSNRVHHNSYYIPSQLENRWITIEYNNKQCNKLEEDLSIRELKIPISGYLCTSSPMSKLGIDKFYEVNEQGAHRVINKQEEINQRYTMSERNDKCNLSAEEFWFGRTGSSDNRSDFIERRHPECMFVADP